MESDEERRKKMRIKEEIERGLSRKRMSNPEKWVGGPKWETNSKCEIN